MHNSSGKDGKKRAIPNEPSRMMIPILATTYARVERIGAAVCQRFAKSYDAITVIKAGRKKHGFLICGKIEVC